MSAPPVTSNSRTKSWSSVFEMLPMGSATMRMPPVRSFEARTRKGGPPEVVEGTVKYTTGSWGSAAVSLKPVMEVGSFGE